MNTIATVVLALLLSGGLLVTPAAAADEPVDPAPCVTGYDGTDAEMTLRVQVDELRVNLHVVEGHVDFLEGQREIDARTIRQMGRKLDHKQTVIDRLRAQLKTAR